MAKPSATAAAKKVLDAWLAERGWKPFRFQRNAWKAVAEGRSGLLHATTGAGKTYAVWLGALMAFSAFAQVGRAQAAIKKIANQKNPKKSATAPLTVLWITPMRALAADTLRALLPPLEALNAALNDDGSPRFTAWSAGARSGDTPAGERSAQNQRLPTVLVTTPESLSLLLARADARDVLGSVRMVVVDEWHELIGNKRGVQVQLALARLNTWNIASAMDQTTSALTQPGPRNRVRRAAGATAPSGGSAVRAATSVGALSIWGMSATLGNLQEAMHTLLGHDGGVLIQGQVPKKLVIDSLLPERTERFPWAGHLGLTMLPQVIAEIDKSSTTLVFANTRSQAELWYQAMLEARPDWAGVIALHHGSLDRAVREWVELGLKNGELKAVVCTSSLDLGVDFLPVERVLQIGSPKGVARLLQRAGRSGHAPGRPSRITLVPTLGIELAEGAAVRAAIAAGHIESRTSPDQPLDVLVQHLVTVALGGGFVPEALYAEVRCTAAYADLSRENWDWCLSFVAQGGASLSAYPDYRRAVPDGEGVWRVPDARLARRHRMNIGTIVSDASMAVQYVGGAKVGTVEESFAARLKPGDCFLFGGRLLALVRIHEMTAWVRRATGKRAAIPRWSGSRLPLSTTLANAVVQQLALASEGHYDTPELKAMRPLLEIQQRWSALPTPQTLLAEVLRTREGWHLFVYPFAGRPVHMGLANLLAWRVAQQAPRTFSIAVNDYGFELLSATEVDWAALLPQVLGFSSQARASEPASPGCRHSAPLGGQRTTRSGERGGELLHEVLASLNASELAQRRFREIARVAGLVFQGYPGEKRSNKQLQASSSLFYEVFKKYDPANRLLLQAEQELLSQELEIGRLQAALERMNRQQLQLKVLARPTPFAFPLMVERFREQLSNESVADRIARMVAQLDHAADDPVGTQDAGNAGNDDDAAAEKVRRSLAFSQDTLFRPSAAKGSGKERVPRRATGRRPGL
ncbi:ATP-dependent Lhr-like helicase [Polaromonas sp. CG_9.7]|uniref:ligase-associated DNA damage response DEXH box helicase n=1 Tax=unclassified Polaromonas TaxID=2638319 RepID=UPI001A255B56|nr:ligase-associated DNA damage response DEXH box helicase [Polaromonas sp. CG_23.6]MBG6072342.1 ATP-dependent Lhr-like helicase [Polaromonas sp. CG_9.7]MBG6114227.1 ATP-dependent Lhr-like helicase [Polaromonas sp. CG_9.2]MDH6182815.1 ATP-dependent Lhr-like helicase [Polaromonas sp. CG_23.6]